MGDRLPISKAPFFLNGCMHWPDCFTCAYPDCILGSAYATLDIAHQINSMEQQLSWRKPKNRSRPHES